MSKLQAMHFVGDAQGILVDTTERAIDVSSVDNTNTFLLTVGGVGDEWLHFEWAAATPTITIFSSPLTTTEETRDRALPFGSQVVIKRDVADAQFFARVSAGSVPVVLVPVQIVEAS